MIRTVVAAALLLCAAHTQADPNKLTTEQWQEIVDLADHAVISASANAMTGEFASAVRKLGELSTIAEAQMDPDSPHFPEHPDIWKQAITALARKKGIPKLCGHKIPTSLGRYRRKPGRHDCKRDFSIILLNEIKTLKKSGGPLPGRSNTFVHEMMHHLAKSQIEDLAWKHCVHSLDKKDPGPPSLGSGASQAEQDKHAKDSAIVNILVGATEMDRAYEHMAIALGEICNFWQMCGMAPKPSPPPAQKDPIAKKDEKEDDLLALCGRWKIYCKQYTDGKAMYEAGKSAFDSLCPKNGSEEDRVVDNVMGGRKKRKGKSQRSKNMGSVNVDKWISEADAVIAEVGKGDASATPPVPDTSITKKFNDKKKELECYINA